MEKEILKMQTKRRLIMFRGPEIFGLRVHDIGLKILALNSTRVSDSISLSIFIEVKNPLIF